MPTSLSEPPIPTNASHAFFRVPLPVGSAEVESWLRHFRLQGGIIAVVIIDDLVQIYKHRTYSLKSGDHPTVTCCQKGGTNGH